MADAPSTVWSAPVSTGARMMAALLWTYAHHGAAHPFVWPSAETLAERTGQSRSGVSRQLSELMSAGLIRRDTVNVGGRRQVGWHLHRGSTTVDSSVHDGGQKHVHDGGQECLPRWTDVSTTVDSSVHHGGTESPLNLNNDHVAKRRARRKSARKPKPNRVVKPRTRMWETAEEMLAATGTDGRTYAESLAEKFPAVDIEHEAAQAFGHVAIQKKTDHVAYVRNWIQNSVDWGRARIKPAAGATRTDKHGTEIVLPPGRQWTMQDDALREAGAVWRDGGWH